MESIISLIQHPHVIKITLLSLSGLIIRQSLVFCGQRWANTYHHLGTYILLPNIALIITSVIKNDIALSLGMIGALSIVRFRNPVKSPFELVMFFGLLTLGIVASVSLMLTILLALLLIVVIFGIKFADQISKKFNFNIFQYSFGDGNLNYTLELNSSEELNEFLKNENIINFYFDKKNNNYSYRIVFKTKKDLMEFTDRAKKQEKILNIRADIQS
ncbi:MAG: DUF4956 domain-containing protein [Rickettsiales bacterium TMED254]|nr:MAG: DUF4956 domain-containing protein [Rickettsiales bacterium TMED254]|tara:strand:+ start:76 stop:723 length:648 start_codon:yes stop_codon:yes gene_type:complete